MDDVFQLNEQELYEKAIKSADNWNRYFIYMTMSANRGYQPAIEKLIRAPFHKQDYKETFPFYEKTKNCMYSMEQLAAIYEKDRDFMQKNEELSDRYYKTAICKGNSIAMTHYGRKLYWSGFKDEAMNLHRAAIELGNCEAAYNLAYSYMYNYRNFEKALEYFELSFEQGYPPARKALISLHRERHIRDNKYVTTYFSNDPEAVSKIFQN